MIFTNATQWIFCLKSLSCRLTDSDLNLSVLDLRAVGGD